MGLISHIFTRKPIPQPRIPIPKPSENIAVSKQLHVENCLATMADKMADVIKAIA